MRKTILLIIFVLLLFASLHFLSATALTGDNITIVTPIASAILNGGAVPFNCSIDGLAVYKSENWSRVRVWMQSAALTANTSDSLITNWIVNTTAIDLNGTMDTARVEDANDYTFKCQLWNGTNYVNATRSGLAIDNTEPTAPTTLIPTSDTDGSVTFSGTVVGRETTSCILYFLGINPGSTSYTMTHTGSTCSHSLTSVPEQSYRWYIRASDESNTTDSNVQTTNVDIKTSAGKAAQMIAEGKTKSEGGALLSVVGNGNGVAGGILQALTNFWNYIKSLFQK